MYRSPGITVRESSLAPVTRTDSMGSGDPSERARSARGTPTTLGGVRRLSNDAESVNALRGPSETYPPEL